MKTAEKNAVAVQGAAKANGTANRVENRPSLTGHEAKTDGKLATDKPAETAQQQDGQTTETKAGNTAPVGNQSVDTAEQAAQPRLNAGDAETQDKEVKAEVRYIKPALNLEQTLKSVNDLHRLSIQRLALISRIKLLEDFEVKLIEEGDELTSNHYEGCKLIIEDDERRQFVTNTPNLIRMVSQFIFNACHEKLADIEANIIFPNA